MAFFQSRKRNLCNGSIRTHDTAFHTGRKKPLSLSAPYMGVIDLIDVAHKYDKNCIYQAIVHDEKSAEYVCGLFRYNAGTR